MSWSFSFSCTALDFDEKATLAQQQWQSLNQDAETEASDQVAAALAAAKAIVYSGAVHHAHGSPEGLYDVALSGHANPGHFPRESWSHDEARVTVRQATPPTRESFGGVTAGNLVWDTTSPPPPSPDNPVPVEVAKEVAPAWEEQIQQEESSGGA